MNTKDIIPYIKLIQISDEYKPKLKGIRNLDDTFLNSLTSYLNNNFLNEYKEDIGKFIDNNTIKVELDRIIDYLENREKNAQKFSDSLSNIETESMNELPASLKETLESVVRP